MIRYQYPITMAELTSTDLFEDNTRPNQYKVDALQALLVHVVKLQTIFVHMKEGKSSQNVWTPNPYPGQVKEEDKIPASPQAAATFKNDIERAYAFFDHRIDNDLRMTDSPAIIQNTNFLILSLFNFQNYYLAIHGFGANWVHPGHFPLVKNGKVRVVKPGEYHPATDPNAAQPEQPGAGGAHPEDPLPPPPPPPPGMPPSQNQFWPYGYPPYPYPPPNGVPGNQPNPWGAGPSGWNPPAGYAGPAGNSGTASPYQSAYSTHLPPLQYACY
jgi:hypothetical protein